MSQRFLDKTDSESENSQDIFSFPLLYEEIDSTIYVIQELLRKKTDKKIVDKTQLLYLKKKKKMKVILHHIYTWKKTSTNLLPSCVHRV